MNNQEKWYPFDNRKDYFQHRELFPPLQYVKDQERNGGWGDGIVHVVFDLQLHSKDENDIDQIRAMEHDLGFCSGQIYAVWYVDPATVQANFLGDSVSEIIVLNPRKDEVGYRYYLSGRGINMLRPIGLTALHNGLSVHTRSYFWGQDD